MAGFSCPMRMVRGVPVITAPAVINGTNAGLLRAALAQPVARGYATVVLDLTDTCLCDAAGLDVLARGQQDHLAEGGELRLVTRSGPVAQAIETAGLAARSGRYRSVAAAVDELPAVAIEPAVC